MADKRTELDKLGEFGLIDRIKKGVKIKNQSSVTGIGDDAAVIDAGDKYLLVTTDMLLEGIHFDLSYMPIKHLGYKSVVVNLSDIAAMNGIPKQITTNLGLSNRFSLEAVDTLYEGIKEACRHYKVDLVGGDTTSSVSGMVLSITALGEVEKDRIAYRKGAKENDILCVTGDLGAAYLGLQILEREKQVFLTNPEMQPQLDEHEYLVHRQLKPEARTDFIHDLKEAQVVPTAMIDISDGLASDVMHICQQSNTGVNIYEDKLPFDQFMIETAAAFKIDPVTCALNGGEDYELLFTIGQEDFEKLKNHPDISTIGYITKSSQGKNLVTKSGNAVAIKAQGWRHF